MSDSNLSEYTQQTNILSFTQDINTYIKDISKYH